MMMSPSDTDLDYEAIVEECFLQQESCNLFESKLDDAIAEYQETQELLDELTLRYDELASQHNDLLLIQMELAQKLDNINQIQTVENQGLAQKQDFALKTNQDLLKASKEFEGKVKQCNSKIEDLKTVFQEENLIRNFNDVAEERNKFKMLEQSLQNKSDQMLSYTYTNEYQRISRDTMSFLMNSLHLEKDYDALQKDIAESKRTSELYCEKTKELLG